MRIPITTNIKNEQSTNMIPLPPSLPITTASLEQTSADDLDVLQPSLPSPPDTKLSLLRPPPFPPPVSSASSSSTRSYAEEGSITRTPASLEDLERFVVNTTRNEETLLTGAAPPLPNTLPRSAAAVTAATASQIPNTPSVNLGDYDFTLGFADFIMIDHDDPGPMSPPTSPYSLFPSL